MRKSPSPKLSPSDFQPELILAMRSILDSAVGQIDSEENIMKAHGDYLQSLAEVGSIVCHGPVDDPKGGWGWVGAVDLFCKGPNGG
jgi:hypothetical protein